MEQNTQELNHLGEQLESIKNNFSILFIFKKLYDDMICTKTPQMIRSQYKITHTNSLYDYGTEKIQLGDLKKDFDSCYDKFEKAYEYIVNFNMFVDDQKKQYDMKLKEVRKNLKAIDEESIDSNDDYNTNLITSYKKAVSELDIFMQVDYSITTLDASIKNFRESLDPLKKLQYKMENEFKQIKDYKTKFDNMKSYEDYVDSFELNNMNILTKFLDEINLIKNILFKQSGGGLKLSLKVEKDENVRCEIYLLLSLYTEKCRRWYLKNKQTDYRDIFFHYYMIVNSINITDEKNIKSLFDGGIADIYPAEKLCLFLIYVSLYEGVRIDNNEGETDLYKIDDLDIKIAAYVLYVYLFNTWCACIMQGKWNSSVSNEYVYEYKNDIINVHKVNMYFDEDNILKRRTAARNNDDDGSFMQDVSGISSDKGRQNIQRAAHQSLPAKGSNTLITSEEWYIIPSSTFIKITFHYPSNYTTMLSPGQRLKVKSGPQIQLINGEKITLREGQEVYIDYCSREIHTRNEVRKEETIEMIENEQSPQPGMVDTSSNNGQNSGLFGKIWNFITGKK